MLKFEIEIDYKMKEGFLLYQSSIIVLIAFSVII
jgi:hypothetical protein